MNPNAPGYKTTEFYVTTVTSFGALVAAIAGGLSPDWAAKVAMVSGGAYALSRAIAKVGPAILTVLTALSLFKSEASNPPKS